MNTRLPYVSRKFLDTMRRQITNAALHFSSGNHLVSGRIEKLDGLGSHFRHGRDMRLCGKITGQPHCPREAYHSQAIAYRLQQCDQTGKCKI